MAHFGKDLDYFKGPRCIHIRSSEQTEHFTLYVITVTVGTYYWTVKRRYSEFYQLNEKLAASHKLDRSLLPPKKIFGHQTEPFIKKRQRELEIYLQTIVLYLAQHIPSYLAYFLDFDKYEIHGITQAMAEDLYSRGESLLLSRDKYEVSTLQLYSLTERLKLPEPTCDSGDVKKDLGHILDFITRAKQLKVVCSKKPVGSSNILMCVLPFDLTLFKSLQTLEICGCNFRLVNGLETVKQTVVKFEVHESTSSMKEILLQDALHWRAEDGTIIVGYWNLVTELDFSYNSFLEIHESIQLMPNIEKLNLSHNTIESIVNLHWLSQLTYIDMSHNNIHYLDSLHTKLGNIKFLRLTHNHLESLHGLAKLFSLKLLDVSYNRITSIEELRFVSPLPCLEELSLEGNPVTSALDYRTKTLEMFADRVMEIVLDNKPADQKELDTVAVLQALKKAKDVKVTKKPHPKKNASAVSLSDMYSQSLSSSISDQPDERNSFDASSSHDLARTPVTSSLADWKKESIINNDSNLSCNSVDERTDECGHHYTPAASLPDGGPAHTLSKGGVNPAYSQSNNNSSHTDIRIDILHALQHDNVPEAHPFDLVLESSYSPSSSLHQLASSFTGGNSGMGTLMFSAADMPTTSNPAFLLWLNKHLFSSVNTTVGDAVSNRKGKDTIMDILWCYAEQLSKPSVLFPCCAVLTKRSFFIEKLAGLESSFPGVPELKPCSMMSIQNIQQLVLGPCHAYIRLEEAFVGKGGVFTLFGIEPQSLKRFFNKLFTACCQFDIINSYSFIDLTATSDLLKMIVLKEEHHFEMSSDRLVSASLVQLKSNKVFSFLVLSENRVYCLNLDCVHWPPPSFESSPEPSIRFNVHHEFSIMDKIHCIKINPHDTHTPDTGKNKYEWNMPETGRDLQFTHFELSLNVTIAVEDSVGMSSAGSNSSEGMLVSSQRYGTSISYYFPSAACRDLFLDRLSNMRSELAHRMSPNIREEPEGGNEQLSPCDRHGLKTWSVPSLKTSLVLPGSTSEQTSQIITDIYKQAISGTSCKDIQSSEIVIQSSYNSKTEFSFHEETIQSEFLESFETIETADNQQYPTLTNSTESYSSSPKEDLSVSPMSNFSRASISPVVGHELSGKNLRNLSQAAAIKHQTSTAKAGSLPSSFDWKRYYFKSPPYPTIETTLNSDLAGNRSGLQGEPTSLVNEIHNHRLLEDIESSSEFEHGVSIETEHESYLKQCVKSYNLIHPLSTKLKPLCLMNGKDLRRYFHTRIAQKIDSDKQDMLCEELHHVMWCMVVPYTNPRHEISTLVMLSTYGIYLVSDTSPKMAHKTRPSWMTHSRNRSDSAITLKSENLTTGKTLVEQYFSIGYKDLLQVNIGLFDQCIRLTGRNENSVFTLVTRDSVVTEIFIQKLKHVLSFVTISPRVEKTRTETESDFYKANMQRTKSTLDGIVYTHPSQVKFVYPGDDAVRDILYLVNERVNRERKLTLCVESTARIWFYMQCYLLPSDDGRAPDRSQPRSVVITATQFCLAEEDVVTYPLPDFVRGVPENPCHDIVECRRIDSLKRITFFHGFPHILCLTFLDEAHDIVVDVSMQHFGQLKVDKEKQILCPEITYRLFIQSVKERDKMVQVLDTLWKGLVTQVGRILDINRV